MASETKYQWFRDAADTRRSFRAGRCAWEWRLLPWYKRLFWWVVSA